MKAEGLRTKGIQDSGFKFKGFKPPKAEGSKVQEFKGSRKVFCSYLFARFNLFDKIHNASRKLTAF